MIFFTLCYHITQLSLEYILNKQLFQCSMWTLHQLHDNQKYLMYESFDIDDQSPQKQQNFTIKTPQKHFTDKFSKSITRNFMHESSSKEQQYHQQPNQNIITSKIESTREKRKNQRLNSKMLKPLSNLEKTELGRIEEIKINLALNILHLEDQDRIDQAQSPTKLKCDSPEPLLQHKKVEIFDDFQGDVEVPSRNEANILFYQEEQSDIQPPESNASEFHIPIHHQIPRYIQEIDMSSNLSAMEEVVVSSQSQYFHIQNKEKLVKEVLQLVKPLHTLKMVLARDNSGFNTFWPQFYLKFPKDQFPVICAKRTTARPISTFILSMSPTDYEQTSNSYLGKIKSNALGDILYVFGPGSNPTNAKQKGLRQRQMIATIRYQSSFFNANKPREFEVFTLKQGFKYFNLKGTKVHSEEPGLDQLFNHQVNRDCMNIYSNRKPIWNDKAGGFMLNFKGRVPCASIKNFILDDPFGHEAMIFGRKQKNQFTLELTDKISPLVAMTVALSAFDTRIMCQ